MLTFEFMTLSCQGSCDNVACQFDEIDFGRKLQTCVMVIVVSIVVAIKATQIIKGWLVPMPNFLVQIQKMNAKNEMKKTQNTPQMHIR